jgi:hypothetical protein
VKIDRSVALVFVGLLGVVFLVMMRTALHQ